MLLNKLPCLDKGYVAHVSSGNDGKRLKEIFEGILSCSSNADLTTMSTMTIVAKCPLFVHLFFSKYGFNIIAANAHTEPDAYMPSHADVQAATSEDNQAISDDISRTTEALLINPKAYQADGCDKFISQTIMPISTYTTIIVHGTFTQWMKLLEAQDLPSPIKTYQENIRQIFTAEWKDAKI